MGQPQSKSTMAGNDDDQGSSKYKPLLPKSDSETSVRCSPNCRPLRSLSVSHQRRRRDCLESSSTAFLGALPCAETADDSTADITAETQGEKGGDETIVHAAYLEKVIGKFRSFSTGHRNSSPKCSIYKVPAYLRDAHLYAFTPQVVSIGPIHHYSPEKPTPYKDMQDCKLRILNYFISQHKHLMEPERTQNLMNRCLTAMKQNEDKIRSYYSFEITMNAYDLAWLMVLDGSFILYLLLDSNLSSAEYYAFGGFKIRSEMVKYDLLLVENQIPFFVLEELQVILALRSENLVERALDLLKDTDLPRNKSIPITKGDQVLHLLDLFHTSLLPTSHSRKSETPIWAIPSATELMEIGVVFEENMQAESFLDINFRQIGLGSKAVMEIPSLNLYDSTRHIFTNLMAFEQCHAAGFDITAYIAFMACIIENDKDVRLLHLKGILINCMTGHQDLTHFFRWLSMGVHTARDRFYLANVFADINQFRNGKLNKTCARFKDRYCSNEWAVFAAVVSLIFFAIAIFQTIWAIYRFYIPFSR